MSAGHPAAPTAGQDRRAQWAVYVALSASFVTVADVSIVNVAAPVIQKGLHASVGDIELAVSGYEIAFGALLICGGRLGDIFGRRAMFTAGFAAFVVASTACGLAASPGQLDAFRVLQGAAAGILSPQVLAIIQVVLTPSRRPAAFAALGAVLGLATILGPLISGAIIVGNFFGTTWRPIFWVNVPIGIAAIALAGRLLPAEQTPGAKRVDVTGTVLLIALCSALTVPLTVGAQHRWPTWTWVSLAAIPVLAVAFLMSQRRLAAAGRDPVLPPQLWADRAFRSGLWIYMLISCGILAFFLYYAILLQYGYRLSTLLTGVATTPSAVGTLILAAVSPRLARRFGARAVVIGGTIICAAGCASILLPLLLDDSRWVALWTAPSLFVAGAGFGMVIPQLLVVVLSDIDTAKVGAAAGLLATAQSVGGGLGVAAMGALFQTQVSKSIPNSTAGQLSHGLAAVALAGTAALLLAALVLHRAAAAANPRISASASSRQSASSR